MSQSVLKIALLWALSSVSFMLQERPLRFLLPAHSGSYLSLAHSQLTAFEPPPPTAPGHIHSSWRGRKGPCLWLCRRSHFPLRTSSSVTAASQPTIAWPFLLDFFFLWILSCSLGSNLLPPPPHTLVFPSWSSVFMESLLVQIRSVPLSAILTLPPTHCFIFPTSLWSFFLSWTVTWELGHLVHEHSSALPTPPQPPTFPTRWKKCL